MATEILQKSRSRITAQSSSALTADEYPGDGSYTLTSNCTTIDNKYTGGSENGKGAEYLQLELDVTSAPGTAAVAKIYWRGTNDGGTKWTKWKHSHTVGGDIETSADFYDAGLFVLTYKEIQLAVSAVDYGFTSVLYATPNLPEVQG